MQTAVPNGTTTIGGLDWLVYDQRDADDPGNYAYSLTTTVDRSSYVLHGTADDTEFETLATALAEQIADETSTRS